MNSLFGAELPTAVNFVIAFVVVLVLIGAATWLVRRLGVTQLDAAARGRQPRLAVIDSAAVDGRRKLVIVRRDNVEHLLMIGGPTDVVVETNIVRAAAAREALGARNGGAETVPRAMPLPEPTPWPLQPESAPAAAHALRIDRGPRVVADEPSSWDAPAEAAAMQAPPVRAVRHNDTLAGLAAELSRPAPEAAAAARAGPAEPAQAAAPPTVPAAASPLHAASAADQSLAEMAQRLEAALRRPLAQKVAERGTARVAIAAEGKPAARPDPKDATQPKPQGNNLEQEMASLLSRPGKT
jgi:flagellar biogenesis protein FliO